MHILYQDHDTIIYTEDGERRNRWARRVPFSFGK